MSRVRLRRLEADYQNLLRVLKDHPRIAILAAHGDPPERYQFQFRVRSLREQGGEIVVVQNHQAEVVLTEGYPRQAPLCRMLTPVFHPNIAPHAICIGDHWTAGEPLSALVVRIGEMLAYQSYNIKSPLNGEAARWAKLNVERLPLDKVDLTPREVVSAGRARPVPAGRAAGGEPAPPRARDSGSSTEPGAPAATVPPSEKIDFACGQCGTRLRAKVQLAGRKIRCPSCQQPTTVPAPGEGLRR